MLAEAAEVAAPDDAEAPEAPTAAPVASSAGTVSTAPSRKRLGSCDINAFGIERLPRANRVLAAGHEWRRSGLRRARRSVGSRRLGAANAGDAGQNKGKGSRSRDLADAVA
jgi:hypothetical protein